MKVKIRKKQAKLDDKGEIEYFKTDNKDEKLSKPNRKLMILRKYQKTFKTIQDTVRFKEPAMILIRRNGMGEWYEGATSGRFVFQHSNGSKRYILLNRTNPIMMGYGNKPFRLYICHEDVPVPLPESPVISTQEFSAAIDKTHHDLQSERAKVYRAKGAMLKSVAIIIGVIVLGLFVYFMFGQKDPAPVAPAAQTAVAVAAAPVNFCSF